MRLAWFDHFLRGTPLPEGPPIRLFVMGPNHWRDENEWPLARTRYQPFYLHSAGDARSLSGDGGLSPEAPGDEPHDT